MTFCFFFAFPEPIRWQSQNEMTTNVNIQRSNR